MRSGICQTPHDSEMFAIDRTLNQMNTRPAITALLRATRYCGLVSETAQTIGADYASTPKNHWNPNMNTDTDLSMTASAPPSAHQDPAAVADDPAAAVPAVVIAEIEAMVKRMSDAQIEAARRQLSLWPVRTDTPWKPATERSGMAQRARAMLTAAADGGLDTAALRLKDWAGPAVGMDQLAAMLGRCIPEGCASRLAVALARRMICDIAGLCLRHGTAAAVTTQACALYYETAVGCADDAGLIDEAALAAETAPHGLVGHLDTLAYACGFVRMHDRLAVSDNRNAAVKAALLAIGPATAAEVAAATGRNLNNVTCAFSLCDSIVRVGRGRWAADTPDGSLSAYASAAAACADEVGLINEKALRSIAESEGFSDRLDEMEHACGLLRIHGCLAMGRTATSAAKAALVSLGRPATSAEIAKVSDASEATVDRALRRCVSVERSENGWTLIAQDLSDIPDPISLGPHTGPSEIARTSGLPKRLLREVPEGSTAVVTVGGGRWFDPQSAVGVFAAAVNDCSDDVGLIDEDRLTAAVAAAGISDRTEELSEQCGLVKVLGRLAEADNTAAAVKAALLELDRPAGATEIARSVGRTLKAVQHVLLEYDSIVRVGPGRWAVDTPDGALSAFAAAAESCADDVGLIDEEALRAITEHEGRGSRFDELETACGLVRIKGRLAMADTATAAAKLALMTLDRPAAAVEVAEIAGMTRARASAAFTTIRSVQRVGPDRWIAEGAGEGRFEAFAEAAQRSADDAGLIDEARLDELLANAGWAGRSEELAAACGLKRVSGRLAVSNTATAAVKAVLMHLGRSASIAELSEKTTYSISSVQHALNDCKSIHNPRRGQWALISSADAMPFTDEEPVAGMGGAVPESGDDNSPPRRSRQRQRSHAWFPPNTTTRN